MTSLKLLSFSSGEISPSLYARTDLSKFQTGLKTCKNFVVQRFGSVSNRSGGRFICEAKDSTKTIRLLTFIFNSTQTYVLEFGDLYFRVIRNGAQVTDLDFGKYVLKHPSFVSGDFDTNFVKDYFSDPSVLKNAMEEEQWALNQAIDQIWNDIKAFKEKEFASREISSSWKNKLQS